MRRVVVVAAVAAAGGWSLTACGGKGVNPLMPSGNQPPQIRSVTSEPATIVPGGSASLVVDAVDPDGDRFVCRFQADHGTVSAEPANNCRATYRHNGDAGTADEVRVSVTDTKNAVSSQTARIAISPPPAPAPNPTPNPNPSHSPSPDPNPKPTPKPSPTAPPNRAPTVSVSRSPSSCHPTCTVTFTASAADPDGDPLTYAWSGCAAGTGTSRTCQITVLNTVTATVTVSDGRGGTATASASATGVNQTPVLSGTPGAPTWPKNIDVVFQFTISDDDPASTGSTINYAVPGQVGTKQGCTYWQGSKWQCELHTSNGGTGQVTWTYKDKWGASVNGSFTATVQ